MNFNYPVPYVKLYEINTTSAVASVVLNNLDFTNYKFYRIYAYSLRPTINSVTFGCRMSIDNGATFVSAANSYIFAEEYVRSDNTTLTSTGFSTFIPMCVNFSAAAPNHTGNFFIDFAPTNTNSFNVVRFTQTSVVSPAALGYAQRDIGMGGLASNGNVNALQFFCTTGSINFGAKFIVYGYPTL